MNDDLFGMETLFEDDGEAGNHVSKAVGVVIRLLLAATTFGFFYLYVGNLFVWLAGRLYSPYVSATVGAFTIDFMAYHWDSLRRNGSTTRSQMFAAKAMTIMDLGLSALVTVVFFILGTDFVSVTNADGSLNDIGLVVNLLGLGVGIIALAGNGIAWAYFEAQDISAKEAIAKTEVRVAQFNGKRMVDKQRTEMQVAGTVSNIQKQLGGLTSAASAHAAQRYADSFGATDVTAPLTEQMAAGGTGKRPQLEGTKIFNAVENPDGTVTVLSEEPENYAPVSAIRGNGVGGNAYGANTMGSIKDGSFQVQEFKHGKWKEWKTCPSMDTFEYEKELVTQYTRSHRQTFRILDSQGGVLFSSREVDVPFKDTPLFVASADGSPN